MAGPAGLGQQLTHSTTRIDPLLTKAALCHPQPHRRGVGYTLGMKTAVSIPDDVFEEAERLAAELQTSRSQFYSRALQEFVARHAPECLTEAMDRVLDKVGTEVAEFSRRASSRVLEQVEW